MLQHGMGQLCLVEDVLHILSADVPHGHSVEGGAFLVCRYHAVLGAGLRSRSSEGDFVLPLVPGSEHFAEQLPTVVRVVRGLVVFCRGNPGSNPIRIAADHVIGWVAVGIDTGIYPHLEWVLPFAGQLYNCA